MVPVFWSKLLAGEGEAPRCLSRYLRSRVVYSSDACKVFLGFSILPLRFLYLTPLVSFSLPLKDFSRSPYFDLDPHSAGNLSFSFAYF